MPASGRNCSGCNNVERLIARSIGTPRKLLPKLKTRVENSSVHSGFEFKLAKRKIKAIAVHSNSNNSCLLLIKILYPAFIWPALVNNDRSFLHSQPREIGYFLELLITRLRLLGSNNVLIIKYPRP